MPERKFGRISPKPLPKDNPDVLHFAAFLKPQLKPPPVACTWYKAALKFPVNLNDQLGCCGPAACAHQIEVFSANTSATPQVLTDQDVLTAYEDVSGYNGTPQTDTGVVMQNLLGYWKNVGIGGNKILASASVDPAHVDRIKWATVIFGGCQLGVNLPQSAIQQTESNQPWSVVKHSPMAGGHDVAMIGYDASGPLAVSWGQLVRITWEFVRKYTEEVWTVIDPSWVDEKGLAPNLLNLGSLMQDLRLI